jgi:hypothetical protein
MYLNCHQLKGRVLINPLFPPHVSLSSERARTAYALLVITNIALGKFNQLGRQEGFENKMQKFQVLTAPSLEMTVS